MLRDPIKADKFIKDLRRAILEEAYLAFDALKQVEEELFRKRSYFINKRIGTLAKVEDDNNKDLEPLNEELGKIYGNKKD